MSTEYLELSLVTMKVPFMINCLHHTISHLPSISLQLIYPGAQVRLDFADSLIRFAPENNLDHLHDTPLLVVHGEINELHPVAEPLSLLANYPGMIYLDKLYVYVNTYLHLSNKI